LPQHAQGSISYLVMFQNNEIFLSWRKKNVVSEEWKKKLFIYFLILTTIRQHVLPSVDLSNVLFTITIFCKKTTLNHRNYLTTIWSYRSWWWISPIWIQKWSYTSMVGLIISYITYWKCLCLSWMTIPLFPEIGNEDMGGRVAPQYCTSLLTF
jgi:hypothetical protein